MKVLLPVDGSKAANVTLEWVMGFMDTRNAEVYLLHVVDARSAQAMAQLDKGETQKILDAARDVLAQKGFSVEEVSYKVGLPAEEIIRYADERDIAMIIIGAQGKNSLEKLLMGSVTAEVFKHAKQQVLVLNNTPRPSLTMNIEGSFPSSGSHRNI